MAITPNPGPQDHTSQAVLCVDRCHSEMILTDSLKHQTVPPNSPEGTGPWTKPPASPPSFCVPLTWQIPSQEEEESPEQGSQGLESLVPDPVISGHQLNPSSAEPIRHWGVRANLTPHTHPDPHAPPQAMLTGVEKNWLVGEGSSQAAHGLEVEAAG